MASDAISTDELLDSLIEFPESTVTFMYMAGYRELYEKARERGVILRIEADPDEYDGVTVWVEPRLPPE